MGVWVKGTGLPMRRVKIRISANAPLRAPVASEEGPEEAEAHMNVVDAGAVGTAGSGDGADAMGGGRAMGHVLMKDCDDCIAQVSVLGDGVGKLVYVELRDVRQRRDESEAQGEPEVGLSGRLRCCCCPRGPGSDGGTASRLGPALSCQG